MLRWSLLIPVLALVAGTTACGDDTTSSSTSPETTVTIPKDRFTDDTGRKTVTVSVVDNDFVDPYITITPGTKVTWRHDGRNPHNIISLIERTFRVDVGDFAVGATYSYTFDKPGDYPYYCSIHGTKKLSGQAGVVRVVAETAK